MKRLIFAATLVAAMLASVAGAQQSGRGDGVRRDEPLGFAVGATDADIALLIERTDATAGYVTVSAAGDILLEQGDTSTADANIECDASIAADGSRNGTLDVSVAACDTLGEICDIINSQGDNEWACVVLDGFRSDTAGPSGTGFILAVSDQDASRSVDGGSKIYWDSSAVWNTTIALVEPRLRKIEPYFQLNNDGTKAFFSGGPFLSNPGTPYFISANGKSTYGSGTSTFYLYSVAFGNPATGYTLATSSGAETRTTLYNQTMGATTVQTDLDFAEKMRYGFPGFAGEKLVARIANSEAMTAVVFAAAGTKYKDR
jgi:hypothetical protein